MERMSSVDNIIGGGLSEEDKQFLLGVTGEVFANGGEIVNLEREKTTQELEICDLMNDLSSQLQQRFGSDTLSVPSQHVHVFDRDLVLDNDQEIGGIFNTEKQNIYVREGRSKIEFADYVLHELIHMKSYQAVQMPIGGEALDWSYRGGFKAHSRDGKSSYFWQIDEGLTEELCKRIVEGLKSSNIPAFSDDIIETNAVKEEYKDNKDIAGYFESGDVLFARHLSDNDPEKAQGYKIQCIPYAYEKQRQVLSELITKIFDRNNDSFKDKDEVFNLFAKGKIQGNFLSIARVIDRTFGVGTFRKLGEASGEKLEDYQKFVESL